jgi:hypothetical protein
MFLHESNTFYYGTTDFSVENCECSKVLPGWGRIEQNIGLSKMGSAINRTGSGKLAENLKYEEIL